MCVCVQGIGEVGLVKTVSLDETKAQIFFVGNCAGLTISTKALKKVCVHSICMLLL